MSDEKRQRSPLAVGHRFAPHREVVENALLVGGLADVARVIGASISVGAVAACIALVVALLY